MGYLGIVDFYSIRLRTPWLDDHTSWLKHVLWFVHGSCLIFHMQLKYEELDMIFVILHPCWGIFQGLDIVDIIYIYIYIYIHPFIYIYIYMYIVIYWYTVSTVRYWITVPCFDAAHCCRWWSKQAVSDLTMYVVNLGETLSGSWKTMIRKKTRNKCMFLLLLLGKL